MVNGKISGRMDRSPSRASFVGGGERLSPPYLFLLLPLGASLTPTVRFFRVVFNLPFRTPGSPTKLVSTIDRGIRNS